MGICDAAWKHWVTCGFKVTMVVWGEGLSDGSLSIKYLLCKLENLSLDPPEALEKARYRFIHLYLLYWDWGDTQINGLADQSV